MDSNQRLRERGKHVVQFVVGHREMRTESRHDVGQVLTEQVVKLARQQSRVALVASMVGWYRQHLRACSERSERLPKRCKKVVVREIGGRGARRKVGRHDFCRMCANRKSRTRDFSISNPSVFRRMRIAKSTRYTCAMEKPSSSTSSLSILPSATVLVGLFIFAIPWWWGFFPALGGKVILGAPLWFITSVAGSILVSISTARFLSLAWGQFSEDGEDE